MSLAERLPFEAVFPDSADAGSALDALAGATSVLDLLRRADEITPVEIDLWAALVVGERPRLYVHAPRPPAPALVLSLAESMADELQICTGESPGSVGAPGQTQTSCLDAGAAMLGEMCAAWRDHITECGGSVVGLSRAGATDPENLTMDRWRRTDEVLEVTSWMLGALGEDAERAPGVIDPITGAYTRAFFEGLLEYEVNRRLRAASELSLVLLQLRRSSPVLADQPAPPALLTAAAGIMMGTLRRSDPVARLDGRRLGAILPGTSPRHGLMAATRVGEALRDCAELDGWSVDVGVSGLGIEVAAPGELIEQARHAMLAAEKGRAETPFVYL